MSTDATDRLLQLAEADRLLRAAETWGGAGLRDALVLARILDIGGDNAALLQEVRRACAYGRPAFAALVTRLVRDGLVVRTTDEFDRRNARLTLTAQGRCAIHHWRKLLVMHPDSPPPDNRRRVRPDDPWRWRFGTSA